MTTTQLTPEQRLQHRMEAAFRELKKIAKQKTPPFKQTLIQGQIGASLGVSGQTVINYLSPGKGLVRRANGYFIDALIEEYKKLPDAPTTRKKK